MGLLLGELLPAELGAPLLGRLWEGQVLLLGRALVAGGLLLGALLGRLAELLPGASYAEVPLRREGTISLRDLAGRGGRDGDSHSTRQRLFFYFCFDLRDEPFLLSRRGSVGHICGTYGRRGGRKVRLYFTGRRRTGHGDDRGRPFNKNGQGTVHPGDNGHG